MYYSHVRTLAFLPRQLFVHRLSIVPMSLSQLNQLYAHFIISQSTLDSPSVLWEANVPNLFIGQGKENGVLPAFNNMGGRIA